MEFSAKSVYCYVFGCMMGRFWTMQWAVLDNFFGGRFGRGRFGNGPFWYRPCQRNSDYKAEQGKYHGTRPLQFPPPFPPLALIYTHLSFSKRGHTASTVNTHHQPSLMVSHYTTCPTSEVVHWASHEAGLNTVT